MDDTQRFRSIISTILSVPEDHVNDDLSPDTIETWDSLNHINLIGALEQEFSVTLPAENLGDSMSIPSLRSLLLKHGVTV